MLIRSLLLVFVLLSAPALAWQEPQSLPVETLAIEAADGSRHSFTVEIAASPQEHSIGLMYRHEMADHHGMLFEFTDTREASFWMKNTFIPLDLLFIRRNGRIANIEPGVPQVLDSIRSRGRVIAVLELNAGTAERLGIQAGDLVRHPFFGTAMEE